MFVTAWGVSMLDRRTSAKDWVGLIVLAILLTGWRIERVIANLRIYVTVHRPGFERIAQEDFSGGTTREHPS